MSQHKLVITEKPSVAQATAAVLGARLHKDGYIEGETIYRLVYDYCK